MASQDEAGRGSPTRLQTSPRLSSDGPSNRSLVEPLLPWVLGETAGGMQRLTSKLDSPQPLTHQLPELVMWAITLLTAFSMACINFVEIFAIEKVTLWKFGTVQQVMTRGIDADVDFTMGVVVLTLICMLFSIIGVSLIEFLAPNCGGSGLPENRCYLNGSVLEGFFTAKTLVVRVTTSILANVAGYPVGREGPTVVIGSNVAYLISRGLAEPYLKQWVQSAEEVEVMIIDEERVAHATRIACAVGGACGMSMIFNSPIGGLLYMFEEITSVAWPLELTFRAFVGTTVATLLSLFFLDLAHKKIRDFVIFSWEPRSDVWRWIDLPWFILVAAAVGAATSLHTRLMIWMAGFRKRRCSARRLPRIAETVLYAAFCAGLSCGASLLAPCMPGHPGVNPYVQFNCDYGQYNPVASLLVNTSHSAVKMLFACDNLLDFGSRATAVAFVAYYLLNVGLSGLPVPGGAFTGTMLLGGLMGRFAGSLLAEYMEEDYAHPGIYAVIGCAAMLCGFKQMTAAVVVICVQCVNNVEVAPVCMLAVSVALAVNRLLNSRGHDEMQIATKRLPFLEAHIQHHLLQHTAGDVCDPCRHRLEKLARFEDVKLALKSDANFFPVFGASAPTKCVGIVGRSNLQAVAERFGAVSAVSSPSQERLRIITSTASFGPEQLEDDYPPDSIPAYKFMDSTPFTLVEDMPLERFHKLFAKEGELAAQVVSVTGEFKGIISRPDLIKLQYTGPAPTWRN
eukprot:TRINITY_DN50898_c0_g1_i1.p1 TRINITY_DN50898_c0_g1~~TRINITY_DN50898_c0_g1_i1.p1  ORF type:complete len:737 (-),score=117.17 TRINITY_DN50898_c0_g1_i1:678-2888(-)